METLVANIVDSFVFRTNTLADTKGSGERKLYLGPSSQSEEFNEFFGPIDEQGSFEQGQFERSFIFDRDNLKKYLQQVQLEYRYEIIQKYKDVSFDRWQELYTEAESLSAEKLTCTLRPYDDGSRYYLHYTDEDADWVFTDYLRRCALPRITEIVFNKDPDPEEPIRCTLRLSSDSDDFRPRVRDPREATEEEERERHPEVEDAIRRFEEELDREGRQQHRERFEELRERFQELFGTERAIRDDLTPQSYAEFLNEVDGRDVLTVGMPVSSDPETGPGQDLRDDFPTLRQALITLLHGDAALGERIDEVLQYSSEVRRHITDRLHVISILLCFDDPEHHSGVNNLKHKRRKLEAVRALPEIPEETSPGERYVLLEKRLLEIPQIYGRDWAWHIRVAFWFSAAFREILERTEERQISTGDLQRHLDAQGLQFPEELLANYVLALQTKGLVLLTGISGTGKSQLVLRSAPILAGYEDDASEDVLTVITVRPDWTDSRGLLGYHNPITDRYSTPKFLLTLLDARNEERNATRQGRSAEPFFMLLDEMNLARVEHYFAEFLSGMESGEPIELHQQSGAETGSQRSKPVPKEIPVPGNLFFAGTVNIDETTHMFSPKVLDRAFTIEFNRVNLSGYGKDTEVERAGPTELRLDEIPVPLHRDSDPSRADWERFQELEAGAFSTALVELNSALEEYSLHFGYRVVNEISRFVLLADDQLSEDSSEQRWAAFDLAVLQKILPKFNGTGELREPLLRMFSFALSCDPSIHDHSARRLWDEWTVRGGRLTRPNGPDSEGTDQDEDSPRLPRAGAKVLRMLRRLEDHGFTSFME